MRGGAANDIYVIPAPSILTFGMATLLSAACCIPAVLSLISMWYKILEIKWKTRFGDGEEEDKVIDGTNGATNAAMAGVKNQIRKFLLVVEIPVFGAAVLAILIIGERNFFSEQVRYQTEPMASIGMCFVRGCRRIADSCRPMGTYRGNCACRARIAVSAVGGWCIGRADQHP